MGYYIQIDEDAYLESGEVILQGSAMTAWEIYEREELDSVGGEKYTQFGIHHMDELCMLINALGGKRGEFISFLLKAKNNQNKIVERSHLELAKEAGVSLKSATEGINILRDKGLLKLSNRSIMIHPYLDRRGNRRREVFLMNLYSGYNGRGRKCGKKDKKE